MVDTKNLSPFYLPYLFQQLNSNFVTPTKNSPTLNATIVSPPPGFEKPAWNLLIPNHNSPITDKASPSTTNMPPLFNPNISYIATYNDVFYLSFLQKFAFSHALSLKDSGGNQMQQTHSIKEAIPLLSFDDLFTPMDQLV